MAEEKERWADWKEYLENHSDIGLFTIAYMHDSHLDNNKFCSCVWTWFTRILLFLVIVVQVTIPVVLFLDRIFSYDGVGFCPGGANDITRILACAVGCIYFTKLNFLYGRKTSETKIALNKDDGVKCKNVLRAFLICDCIMNTIYEALVYLLNLWIVFLSPEPLDLVLNALAMEFILNLDDGIKKNCIAIYFNRKLPEILTAYEEAFQIPSPAAHDPSFCENCWHYLFMVLISLYICGVGVFVIYLPWCKPGAEALVEGVVN